MTVVVTLAHMLPIGLKGALCAVMLAAFISTHDTYLHSWGSIFIQDVLSPLLKKPLKAKEHMLLLRLSILGVAVFIFLFSLLFNQTQAILMFFALTGTLFVGGAGSAIIGGLYWKRGTTKGAYGALITGAIITITAFICEQVWPRIYGCKFPINGQYIHAMGMGGAIFVYIFLSLIERKIFNLDRMLHRGKYAVENETKSDERNSDSKTMSKWEIILRRLGLSDEFTFFDKILFFVTICWAFSWLALFCIGTIYATYMGCE